MLVAKVEIWPGGDEEEKRHIGTLKIANIKQRKTNIADYALVLEYDGREIWRYLRRYNRRSGAMKLVTNALIELSY